MVVCIYLLPCICEGRERSGCASLCDMLDWVARIEPCYIWYAVLSRYPCGRIFAVGERVRIEA